MRQLLKRVLSCVMVILLLIGVLGTSSDIMQRKDSDYKYKPFFDHAKDMDALFIGTSHVLNGVFPMELWNDYGITSYNFGGHGNEIATTYWVLMNALDYVTPKVVVVDCFKLISAKKSHSQFEYLHVSLDAFPLSWTKVKTAFDLLNDPGMDVLLEQKDLALNEKHTKLGLIWDYSVYHTRWKDLSQNDFEPETTIQYGADSRIRIVEPQNIVPNTGLTTESESIGERYLKKIIEECQNRDIDVVLTFLPYPVYKEDRWMEVNTAAKIADEYGVEYIDFINMDLVDYSVDMYDPASHLNPAGAMKVTDYLGKTLREKYNLEDHRSDPQYSHWTEDYNIYKESKNQRLNEQNDLNTYLMLLEDNHYGYLMSIGDPSIFSDDVTVELLKNKGVNIDEINQETKYIFVCGKNSQVINETISMEMDTENKVNIKPAYKNGGFAITPAGNGKYIVLKGSEKLCTFTENALSQPDQAISVNVFEIDNPDHIVNNSTFAIDHSRKTNKRAPNKDGVVILSSSARRIQP